jgi:hypothetical protein
VHKSTSNGIQKLPLKWRAVKQVAPATPLIAVLLVGTATPLLAVLVAAAKRDVWSYAAKGKQKHKPVGDSAEQANLN